MPRQANKNRSMKRRPVVKTNGNTGLMGFRWIPCSFVVINVVDDDDQHALKITRERVLQALKFAGIEIDADTADICDECQWDFEHPANIKAFPSRRRESPKSAGIESHK